MTVNWYSVSTFRHVADHAYASISRGDPVIVIGRMVQRNWEANGRTGTSMDIEAETVGLDLRWGTGSIQRRGKSDEEGDAAAAAEGVDAASDEGAMALAGDDSSSSAAAPEAEWVSSAPLEDAPVPF